MAIGGLVTGVIAVLLGTVVGIGYWVAWQVGEHAVGDRFAVDEHAVAIENDGLQGEARRFSHCSGLRR